MGMNNMTASQKIHGILLSILGAAGVVAIVWWGVQTVMHRGSDQATTERTYDAVVNYEQLPKTMPRFLLLGGTPTIIHGAEDKLNGQVSSNAEYTTPTTLSDLYDMYKGYFTEAGWTLQNEFKSDELAVLVANRYRDTFTVSIEPKGGKTSVDVSLVKAATN
jgi:hypothetical protein